MSDNNEQHALYQRVMDLICEATVKFGYVAAIGICEMAKETVTYNFRKELAEQIMKKELNKTDSKDAK